MQAWIIKYLKKEKTGNLESIAKACQDHLNTMLIEKASVEKCLEELIEKQFISLSNDVYEYIV